MKKKTLYLSFFNVGMDQIEKKREKKIQSKNK